MLCICGFYIYIYIERERERERERLKNTKICQTLCFLGHTLITLV